MRADDLGATTMHLRASAGDSEYFDAAMRTPLLTRIAEDTGGRFFTPANASSLPEAISYSGRGVTVVEERDLWDMPIILMALIALVGGEWALPALRGGSRDAGLRLAGLCGFGLCLVAVPRLSLAAALRTRT